MRISESRLISFWLILAMAAEAVLAKFVTGYWIPGGVILCIVTGLALLRPFMGRGPLLRLLGLFSATVLFLLLPAMKSDSTGELANSLPLAVVWAISLHVIAWSLALEGGGDHCPPSLSLFAAIGGLLAAHGAFRAFAYEFPASWTQSAGLVALAGSIMVWWNVEAMGERAVSGTTRTRWILGKRRGTISGNVFFLVLMLLGIWWGFPVAERGATIAHLWLGGDSAVRLEDFGPREVRREKVSGGGANTGERELPKRLSLEPGDGIRVGLRCNTDAEYAAAVASPLYLRGWSLGNVLEDSVLGPDRLGEWRFDADDGVADGWTQIGDKGEEIRLDLFLPREEFPALPLPPTTNRVASEAVYEYADDWYQILPEDKVRRVRLSIGAHLPVPTVESIDPASLRFPGAERIPRPRLPESAWMETLKILGKEALPENAGLAEQLRYLRKWLQERCHYSLHYENPLDLPAVENFLQKERQGHCELFAASAMMLLQGQGIPARIAYGYCGGEGNAAERTVIFRNRDFHAWVELPIRGKGWMVYDVTPGEGGGEHRPRPMPSTQGNSAGRAGWRWDEFDELKPTGVGLPLNSVIELGWQDQVLEWLRSQGAWGMAILGGLALLGGVRTLWLYLLQRRKSGPEAQDGTGNDGEGFPGWLSPRNPGHSGSGKEVGRLRNALLAHWSARGQNKEPGETLREFVFRVASDDPEFERFISIVDYLYRVSFAGSARDTVAERTWANGLRN